MARYGSVSDSHFDIHPPVAFEETVSRNSYQKRVIIFRLFAILSTVGLVYLYIDKTNFQVFSKGLSKNEVSTSSPFPNEGSSALSEFSQSSDNLRDDPDTNDVPPYQPLPPVTQAPSIDSVIPWVKDNTEIFPPDTPQMVTLAPSSNEDFPRVWNSDINHESNPNFKAIGNIMADYIADENRNVVSLEHMTGEESAPEDQTVKELFSKFTENFSKKYSTAEEAEYRYSVFKANVKLIQQRNVEEQASGSDVTYTVNKFSDLTTDEFLAFAGGVTDMDTPPNAPVAEVVRAPAGVTFKNWAGTLTTPIKDQGSCGSCWAFGTVEQLETDSIRLGVQGFTTSTKLSPQQLVSCDIFDGACNGGSISLAMAWIALNGGAVYESDFPYSSATSNVPLCKYSKSNAVVVPTARSGWRLSSSYGTIGSYTYTFASEYDMAQYVLTTGPITQAIYVPDSLNSYSSGVITSCFYSVATGHSVQLVGINMNDANNQYWIARNSWGANWGMSGYFYIRYGQNLCGIGRGEYAVYTVPSLVGTHPPAAAPLPSATPTAGPTGSNSLIWSWKGPQTFSSCSAFSYGQNCVPNNPVYDALPYPLSTTFTVALWVTPATWTKSDTDVSYLVSLGVTPWTSSRSLRLIIKKSQRFSIYDDCVKNSTQSVATLSANTRTHIAVVRSGLSYSYYVNGLLDGAYTAASSAACSSSYTNKNWALGTYLGGGNGDLKYLFSSPLADYNFQGSMEVVNVYQTALTSAQINALYTGAVPSSSPTMRPTAAPSTKTPSAAPSRPTRRPTAAPSAPTRKPTRTPTSPSRTPTSFRPTRIPTMTPSLRPTAPTNAPSESDGRVFSYYLSSPKTFDGVTSDAASLSSVLSAPFTVTFFLTTTGTTYLPLVGLNRKSGSKANSFQIMMFAGGNVGYQDDCTGNNFVTSASVFNTGTRRQFAVKKEGSKYTFYTDGVYAGEFTASASCTLSGTDLIFGYDPYYGMFYSGKLDSIQIYNKALSDSTISSLYTARK